MNLTNASLRLFLDHAADAGNWNGQPLLNISKQERGNLTQLKRAGLVTTFKEDDGNEFMQFTEAGVALAASHQITI